MSLTSDNVFGDDRAAAQLATVGGDVGSGFTVSLPVAVDTSTTQTGGSMGGSGGGRGGPLPSN